MLVGVDVEVLVVEGTMGDDAGVGELVAGVMAGVVLESTADVPGVVVKVGLAGTVVVVISVVASGTDDVVVLSEMLGVVVMEISTAESV